MKINRMDGLKTGQPLKAKKKVKEEKGPELQKDGVILSGDKGGGPNLIVGAYTGRLNPQIPPGSYHTLVPIGLEIQNGVGISLDGESLIVAHSPKDGQVSIKGHLEPGQGEPVPESGVLYPQRDFEVSNKGGTTKVDGFYDWQDYTITRKDGKTTIDCADDMEGRFDYQVFQDGNKTIVKGKYPAQNFVITRDGNKTYVKGCDDNMSYTLTTEGNKTKIEGNIPERQFTVTDKGKELAIDGHMAYQDFKVTKGPKEFTIKGYYPQQKYEVSFKG